MNIYFIGIILVFVMYIWISYLISKRVTNINDFYVAGRNTPAYLITGSLVASFIGVGLFMGDVGEAYSGLFSPIIVAVGVMSVGYILGSVFFGRYLRRSEVLTIPEYFGKRFDSPALQNLSTITGTFIMLVYSLSTVQGVSVLMSNVANIDYNKCIIIAVAVFTLITVFSGAKGVLITDTIMFGVFSVSTIIGIVFVAKEAGGWFTAVESMAQYDPVPGILSWSGSLDYFYATGKDNMIWALGYGIAWMSVLMIAPWQSSRYLMAKNEHAVIRSSILASASVFIIEFLMCMAGVFVQKINSGMEHPSHALIWASMNAMPAILGIIVLSGVLAAGISSATTFLSLICSSIANDILRLRNKKHSLAYGRIIVVIVGILIGTICIYNPPRIFWITYLGATIVSCSWFPVCIASVWSKRVTKAGAFWSMLLGFITSSILKIYTGLKNITPPIFLDPFFIGLFVSIISLILVSAVTKVTSEEREQREKLFVMPDHERDPVDIRKTKISIAMSIPVF